MTSSANRPWQGTVLGVLNAIGIVLGILGVIGLLVGGSFIAATLEEAGMSLLAGLGTTVLAIVIIPFLILGVFITLGLFKGQKWTVILGLVFTVLGTVGNITTFNIVGLLFNAFFIYCYVICLKDPYYNK